VEKYGNFECKSAAIACIKNLKSNGFGGTVIDLQSSIANHSIWSKTAGKVISTNGTHRGVMVNGKVFDNIHKKGTPYAEWIKDFEPVHGAWLDEHRSRF